MNPPGREPGHPRAPAAPPGAPGTSGNLEVFVREPDAARIAAWGAALRAELRDRTLRPDETIWHDASGAKAFAITPGIGGSDFTSVWVSPTLDGVPFRTDVDMARAAFRALGVETRCCPGGLAPNATPSQVWSVSAWGERLIEWWPPDDVVDAAHFHDVFSAVGARPRPELFHEIVARYAEPDRAYHTVLHLSEAYGVCMESPARVERWHEVEIALWFHDAIYDTHRHDNEERSADWARDELLAAGAAADVAARVHALVLATKHRGVPEDIDARFLVDADLSILAAPPDRFAAYERQIRREYDWVPEPQFREARERFLRAMLARPSVFSVPEMRERHEAHARRNLEESLRRLASQV